MFRCNNGLGPIMTRGMAAFLLLLMLLTVPVFAEDDTSLSNGSSEIVATTENSTTSGIEEQMGLNNNGLEKEPADVVLFSVEPEGKASSMKVKLDYKGRVNYEGFFTRQFFVEEGGEKHVAYCVQPKEYSTKSSSITAKESNKTLMNKVLYYSYGYPGYPMLEEYLKNVDRKKCYKGNKGTYALCHILLSYLYDSQSASSDAFTGVSSGTKKVIKAMLEEIKTWPDPKETAGLKLTSKSAKVNWNKETKKQTTDAIKLEGGDNNSIQVKIPEGTILIKSDSNGINTRHEATEKSVTIKVGESFSFEADSTKSGVYKSEIMSGSLGTFKPYIVTISGKQDVSFGVNDVSKVSFEINWLIFGEIIVQKISGQEDVTKGRNYYSTEGAEFGIYDEKGELVNKLTTDSTGKATSDDLPYGKYTIKELNAPRGYKIDVSDHEIEIKMKSTLVYLKDEPFLPRLATSASEHENGEIVDKVEYEGLSEGYDYLLKGQLIDKGTGNIIEGTFIEKTFKAEKSSGVVDVVFNVDLKEVAGKTLVAFEQLYWENELIASHEDINATSQTVSIKPTPKKPEEHSPKTGDKSLLLVLVLLVLSGIVLFLTALHRRRKRLI